MKLTYALLRKQRTHNLRYIVRPLLMKLVPVFYEDYDNKPQGLFSHLSIAYHRVPKSIDCHQLETGEVYEYSTC